MSARIRKRWRLLVAIAGLWFAVMFPIPFLPALGYHVNKSALDAIVIISTIVTVPFTFLAIFINDPKKARP